MSEGIDNKEVRNGLQTKTMVNYGCKDWSG